MLTTYVHHILFIFSTKYLSKTWTMKLIVVALTFDFTHNRPDSAQKLIQHKNCANVVNTTTSFPK